MHMFKMIRNLAKDRIDFYKDLFANKYPCAR